MNITAIISDGDFGKLKKRVHDDLYDVACLVEPIKSAPPDLMRNLINVMVDLWFERKAGQDDYKLWTPKANLISTHEELIKERDGHINKVNEELKREINKRYRKALDDQRKTDAVTEMLKNVEIVRTKRVASTQLTVKKERAKRMRGDWDEVFGLCTKAYTKSKEYTTQYGELAPPPNVKGDNE